MQFRDLKAQYEALKSDIDAAMTQVASDCNFISGKQVSDLETELAEYVGVKHCITCGNGTDALTMMMMAWNIKEGDAVFVPDLPFSLPGRWCLLKAQHLYFMMCAKIHLMQMQNH